ncbi:hypothetical protein [Novosphingobium sp.]|uniref:hypothetical protein n=1 Tax=Novosphingobium sp. TaxID=1874826 RepID=UPI002610CA2B|nr:hypothetical protein [Novosphingobium sp.]
MATSLVAAAFPAHWSAQSVSGLAMYLPLNPPNENDPKVPNQILQPLLKRDERRTGIDHVIVKFASWEFKVSFAGQLAACAAVAPKNNPIKVILH